MTIAKRLSGILAAAMTAAIVASGTSAAAAPADGGQDGLQQKVTSDEAFGSEQVVRSEGHIDLGPKVVEGGLVFAARDDTESTPVWRHLDDLVLQVGDTAKTQIPEGDQYDFTGASTGEDVWIIPQVEQPGAPWLGWNTQDPAFLDGAVDNVTLRFTGAQGPGKVSLFLQNGDFGEPDVLWTADKAADVNVDLNTHTHANWVFTKPGIYLVTVSLSSKRSDGTTSEDTQTIRLAVGDDADPKEAAQAEATQPASGEQDSAQQADSAAEGADPAVLIAIGIGAVAVLAAVFFTVIAVINRRRRAAGDRRE